MLFSSFKVPEKTAFANEFQPMKNGYFHVFKGASSEMKGKLNKLNFETIRCQFDDAILAVIRERDLSEECRNSIDEVRESFRRACPSFTNCNLSPCQQLHMQIRKCT